MLMKRSMGLVLAVAAILLLAALPLRASITSDVKAKKPMLEVLQNGIIEGLTWEESVCQVIKAGGDPSEAITTALNMGADPQQVVRGAKCGNINEQTIRNAFAKAQQSGNLYGARGPVQPLMPIAPSYWTGGGGGGGAPASPFR